MQPQNSSHNLLPSSKHLLLLLTIFFVITFLVYLPSLHAKFVADFIDMVFAIQKRPPLTDFSKGILFDFVNRFVFQTWLSLFGFNVWAWHFLQCFLHSLNVLLFYTLIALVLNRFNYVHSNRLALLISFCFLFSPYHTEPVVWGGDLNYLLVGNFIFLHLLTYFLYLQTQQKRYALVAILAFIFGAFTHELAWFLIPADLILAFTFAPSFSASFSKNNLRFWFACCFMLAIYFANKMLSGNLVGHYGSSVHLRFPVKEIVPAFFKYILKVLCFSSFAPLDYVNLLYHYLDTKVAVIIMLLAPLPVTWFLVKRIQKSPAIKAPVAFFLLFALFIFPVLNLYFPYWIKIDGDRYCYITSAFLVASCIVVLYTVKPALSFLFSFVYLACSICFLFYNIQSWHQAGIIMTRLEETYRWKSANHVYILNIPDDYRGAYMYRSLQEPNAFSESFIKYGADIPDGNRVTAILGYNLTNPADSVTVQVNSPNQLYVALSAQGSWFWRNAQGTGDYEDTLVKVHFDQWVHGYTVTFKKKEPGNVFLYCANGSWRNVQSF